MCRILFISLKGVVAFKIESNISIKTLCRPKFLFFSPFSMDVNFNSLTHHSIRQGERERGTQKQRKFQLKYIDRIELARIGISSIMFTRVRISKSQMCYTLFKNMCRHMSNMIDIITVVCLELTNRNEISDLREVVFFLSLTLSLPLSCSYWPIYQRQKLSSLVTNNSVKRQNRKKILNFHCSYKMFFRYTLIYLEVSRSIRMYRKAQ